MSFNPRSYVYRRGFPQHNSVVIAITDIQQTKADVSRVRVCSKFAPIKCSMRNRTNIFPCPNFTNFVMGKKTIVAIQLMEISIENRRRALERGEVPPPCFGKVSAIRAIRVVVHYCYPNVFFSRIRKAEHGCLSEDGGQDCLLTGRLADLCGTKSKSCIRSSSSLFIFVPGA